MKYLIYKIVHIVGIAFALGGLGTLAAFVLMGGKKGSPGPRKAALIAHGLGMFLLLLGGFGMLATLGMHSPWPKWVLIKFGAWTALALLVFFAKSKPLAKPTVLFLGPALVGVAAWAALFKPFL